MLWVCSFKDKIIKNFKVRVSCTLTTMDDDNDALQLMSAHNCQVLTTWLSAHQASLEHIYDMISPHLTPENNWLADICDLLEPEIDKIVWLRAQLTDPDSVDMLLEETAEETEDVTMEETVL